MTLRALLVVIAAAGAGCSPPATTSSTPPVAPPTPRSPADASTAAPVVDAAPAVIDAATAAPTTDATAPALSASDCKALAAAPALAIATVVSTKADCSGIGNRYIVFEVARLVRGTNITRVVARRPLYGRSMERFTVGDTFVVAIEPRVEAARTVQCVAVPAHEGSVQHEVRTASVAEAERMIAASGSCP